MASNANTDVDKLITFGQMALEQGWYDQARQYFQQALELNPASFEAEKGLHQIDGMLERRKASSRPVEVRLTEPIGKKARRRIDSITGLIREGLVKYKDWVARSAEAHRRAAEEREKRAREMRRQCEERDWTLAKIAVKTRKIRLSNRH